MKQKTLTIVLGMIFLIGIVTAATLTNVTEELIIPNFIAGGTTSTTFSFDYASEFNDITHKPLVIRVNISSLIEGYPVWKGDFSLTSFIEQYTLWDLFFPPKLISLNCVEESEINFPGPEGVFYTETNIPDGIFYCYDPANYLTLLELDRRDKVNLSITSDPALYPGEYSVGVELLEVTSEQPQPENEYIRTISIDAIDDSNMVPYKTNQTVILNITLEIKGGNYLQMNMTNLTSGGSPGEGGIVIYEHTYSPEDLNARILYHNTNYSVGNSYEDFHNETNSTDKWIGPLPWTDDLETITRVNIIFKLDINENMEPGNYHASFQFRAATENEI